MNDIKYLGRRIIILILIIFLTSCQANPDEEAVKGKNDLEGQIADSTTEENTILDRADWTYKFESGVSHFIINADIDVPDVTIFPVIQIQRINFTDEQAATITNFFFNGQTIYDGNMQKTKAEIQAEIVEYMRTMQESGSEIDANDEYLSQLQQQYASAPEYVEKKIAQPVWSDTKTQAFLGAKEINIVNENKTMRIDGITDQYDSFLRYSNIDGMHDYEINEEIIGDYASDDNLVQAETLALNALKKMNIKNMVLSGRYTAKSTTSQDKKGYILIFVREYQGVPFTFVNQNSSVVSEGQEYNEPMQKETISFSVDKDGIQSFVWNNPYEITGIVSENVQLLAVDKIKEIYINYMQKYWNDKRGYALNEDKITLYRMSLGMAVMRSKNDNSVFLSVPVWDFFVKRETTDISNKQHTEMNGYSILTVNAITGAFVDRNAGY